MTAAAKLISVVIPTRDRNESLARCLDRLAPCAQSAAATPALACINRWSSPTTVRTPRRAS